MLHFGLGGRPITLVLDAGVVSVAKNGVWTEVFRLGDDEREAVVAQGGLFPALSAKMVTLVLDVVDAATRRLVWRGSAQAEVSTDFTPADRDETLENAVVKMFAGFPPGVEAR